ncbi:MAG: nitrile hydratase subunit beta [Hyphomicrobiaceae bacterium]|nr:MAG: nitrile hydratase subunit beta [Hyphomicrobiaceae bacterium]
MAVSVAVVKRARFKPGDRVRIASRASVDHCRTPWYTRGRRGVVTAVQGAFGDPGRLAYHKPGLPPLVLYKVRVPQGELWTRYAGPQGDTLEVDIFEPWLEPV